MRLLDGLYRHGDTSLVWDDLGVTVKQSGDLAAKHAGWASVLGARQTGERPGFVQLLIRGHVPPANPAQDVFSVPVASDADAKRLIMSIRWCTQSQTTELRPRRGFRRGRIR